MSERRFLVDTDVMIDFLKGVRDAVDFLANTDAELLISVISVAELYAGVREGSERTTLDSVVSALEVISVNGDIAVTGGLYRRDFRKSHKIELADALIAATAHHVSATLVTLNQKHFPMLPNVFVPYRKS